MFIIKFIMSLFTRKSPFFNSDKDIALDKFEGYLFDGKFGLEISEDKIIIRNNKGIIILSFNYEYKNGEYITYDIYSNSLNKEYIDYIATNDILLIQVIKICIKYEDINIELDNNTFEDNNSMLHRGYESKLREISKYRDRLISELNKLEYIILRNHNDGELVDEKNTDIYDEIEKKNFTIKEILDEYKHILREVHSKPPLFHLTYRNMYKLDYLIDLFDREIDELSLDYNN